jgi:hypothetical protein
MRVRGVTSNRPGAARCASCGWVIAYVSMRRYGRRWLCADCETRLGRLGLLR